MASGSLMTRLSPWLSWSVKPYHLKRLNKQTRFWQPLQLKNSSIILHLRSPTKASQNPLKDLKTDPVFWGIASNNTLVTCAQRPEKSAATATKPAISHTFVSRPSEPSDPPHGNYATLASPTPIADKGHFVMLDLRILDSPISKQIPFQIDSAASCNTLPSNHLTNIPCAKISPSKTVILPYASPPTKPIGHVTLTASKGRSTCDLTFHIINAEQPALLETWVPWPTVDFDLKSNVSKLDSTKVAVDTYEATGQLMRESEPTD
ncbi:unnamed protein product [Porites evermanni]|uniref:Ubiquitin 3 binding protein But2 C-terminal domain-containing protein n=1 Tax=Porites evermanni TaxID=104178 RepID=A0ABN8T0H2_9CNID|nr:unnamed protein product [Porites evermanni]